MGLRFLPIFSNFYTLFHFPCLRFFPYIILLIILKFYIMTSHLKGIKTIWNDFPKKMASLSEFLRVKRQNQIWRGFLHEKRNIKLIIVIHKFKKRLVSRLQRKIKILLRNPFKLWNEKDWNNSKNHGYILSFVIMPKIIQNYILHYKYPFEIN